MLLAAFQFVEDPTIAAVTPLSLAETLAEEGFALTHMEQKLIFRRFDRSLSCLLISALLHLPSPFLWLPMHQTWLLSIVPVRTVVM